MANSILTTDSGQWKILGELPPQPATDVFEEAMSAARAAKENAYAPYSNFHVGAAVSMDGILSAGCNVENASYGGTMCAERAALFSAVAAGAQKLTVIAITTDARTEAPIESRSPCGLCRQVMAEFAGDETLVLLDGGSGDDSLYRGEIIRFDDLLPWRFRLQ